MRDGEGREGGEGGAGKYLGADLLLCPVTFALFFHLSEEFLSCKDSL